MTVGPGLVTSRPPDATTFVLVGWLRSMRSSMTRFAVNVLPFGCSGALIRCTPAHAALRIVESSC
jgi:hypothetical protein